ncbi:hypothetical protein ACVOMT_22565 [Sphingomonas panni]
MLKGGSMADFIEAYARTCRKYGASLVTATQSLNDYYKSDGLGAALENSDWFVILQQKAETIAGLQEEHDRFEMDDHTDALLRSLKRQGVEYSDVLIKGPDMLATGRLVLDPYSATVFSSPRTFAAIHELLEQGLTMEAAIERIAFPDNPEKWSDGHDDLPIAAE